MCHYQHINIDTASPWFTQKKLDTENAALAGL